MNPVAAVNNWIWGLPWHWRIAAYLGLLGLSGLLVLWIAYQLYTWRAPTQEELWQVNRVPSLTVFDENGATLAIRGAFYGERLGLDELPVHVAQAFIAIEDRRFYNHSGFDFWGFARAMMVNVREGGLRQGGSTITQQLAKNLFLSNERTIGRKLHEVALALWLERHLGKDEILTIYMNRIYLGAGAYGIDAAARYYFGKSARGLTLAEAAMLAGLPKAPSRYAPTTDLAQAQARAELVITSMLREGFITEDEAAEAIANPASPVAFENTDGQQYFVDYVISEIDDLIGPTSRNLIVTTTLDRNMQALAEQQLAFHMDRDSASLNAEQAALVTLSPDGAIRAMVGGRDYADTQFNRAVQALRQPGSAFKPFIYLTALEAGYLPSTIMIDQELTIDNWSPRNYSGTYAGSMTLRDALRNSVNTIAVQLSENVGRENVIDTAHAMGITTDLPPHPSIALGAGEVTLLDMTDAYLTIQASGTRHPAYAITQIRAEDGTVLYTREVPEAEEVAPRALSQELTGMLFDVVQSGTGRAANLGRREAAGKTGTTQDWRDAWFVGFTADYVTGVWVGNDDSSPMNHVTGGSLPASIWRDYMAAAHDGLPLRPLAREGGGGTEIAQTDDRGEQPTSNALRDFLYDMSVTFEETARRMEGRRRR